MNSFVVGSNRKIDPSRRAHLQGDGTPADNDRVEMALPVLLFQNGRSRADPA